MVARIQGLTEISAVARRAVAAPIPQVCATLGDARRAMRSYLESIRTGAQWRHTFTNDVWDALELTGELAEWERREELLLEAMDEANVDDSPDATERWYTFGDDRFGYYLDITADDQCRFMLGVPNTAWLHNGGSEGVVFISARRLARRKSEFPDFDVELCIDSGGFTELHKYGRWVTTAAEYVALVRKVSRAGVVRWAAIQDWMCEDSCLRKTGLTVLDHQRRTIASFLELSELAPEIRWLPVLQGKTLADYHRHVAMYLEAGVDLQSIERVGVGSVCRRKKVSEIVELLQSLAGRGLRLHAFGVKSKALHACAGILRSADSMAWSFAGRYETLKTGRRDSKGRSLANSQEYAEQWRRAMQWYIDDHDFQEQIRTEAPERLFDLVVGRWEAISAPVVGQEFFNRELERQCDIIMDVCRRLAPSWVAGTLDPAAIQTAIQACAAAGAGEPTANTHHQQRTAA